MSKLQQTFTEILRKKKRVIGVTEANQKRWRNGSASPTIKTMEKICTDNEIELPFFFDGQIESLIEYNNRVFVTKLRTN